MMQQFRDRLVWQATSRLQALGGQREPEVSPALARVRLAFFQSLGATLACIILGLGFKVWLAQWVVKDELALYHTVVDVISLSLIMLTGFRSSMVVAYNQTRKEKEIINLFRVSLLVMVLATCGLVIPYINQRLDVELNQLLLVAVVLAMALKIYATNLMGMYRLYEVSNRVLWLEPLSGIVAFALLYGVLALESTISLFGSLGVSSLSMAVYMLGCRRRVVATQPLARVRIGPEERSFLKRSLIASVEAGTSVLMIYIMVLLTVQYFSLEELGNFQVVVRPVLTYMTLLFVFPIYRFVLPELARSKAEGDQLAQRQIRGWITRLSLTTWFIFFYVSAVWGDNLIALTFPEQYAEASPVLTHIALFFGFMMLNALQLCRLKAEGRFGASLLTRLAGVAALVGVYHLLSMITGNVVSVVIAFGMGYLVMWLMSARLLHQRTLTSM